MSLHDIIDGKREWRAHVARVKALPPDYQIVYKEIQKYLFKVGPVEPAEGTSLLSGLVDLFAEGAAAGKGVLDITGSDVAAFCDDLVEGSGTYARAVSKSSVEPFRPWARHRH
jgi:DNA-binding ferritin-like protein (Dps family)